MPVSRSFRFLAIALVLGGCVSDPIVEPEDKAPPRTAEPSLEQLIEQYRRQGADSAILHIRQVQSVDTALYTPSSFHPGLVPLPGREEVARFRAHKGASAAFDHLDDIYLHRDDLKALAIRDSDGDGVADYVVSDYFGKFMEGDIDIDGDGVRNALDPYPYQVSSDSGPPPGNDVNDNGVPDHVDLALRSRPEELAAIQSGLLRDHGILMVERGATFDLALARAVDDTVRRLFRAWFERSPVMPTLRTLAVERTALLSEEAQYFVGDRTSAQTFSNTQSLTVYDQGRAVDFDIGLLGLIVHEMGHSYHMTLDFDAGDLAKENARTDFPARNFAQLLEPFGWKVTGYATDMFNQVVPRFAYVGISEPVFEYRERTPDAWRAWLLEQYESLDEDPDYLKQPVFAERHIVGSYALSSPYEWFCDNLVAYVVTVLERHTTDRLEAAGRPDAVEPARDAIESAIRGIWPDFHHRNIAPDVFAWFEQNFPITPADRRFLARRYMDPIVASGRASARGPGGETPALAGMPRRLVVDAGHR